MSRYPVYGVSEDPVWTRGQSAGPPQASTQYVHQNPYPSGNMSPYHTTVVHSTHKPVSDADVYRVGIYGWRKRCLYVFIVILTILIVLNLAVTLWIMSVLDFSKDGMGALRIENDGIRVKGRAQFDRPVHLSHLSTARDEALLIDSFRGVNIQARNLSGQVASRLSLNSEGRATAVCERFEIFDRDNKLLFFADSDEIGLKLENLRILDDGGSVFEGAIQTAFIRPEPDTPLRLESPTRSVSIEAGQDVEMLSSAGEIHLQSLLDLSLVSKQGEIRLDSSNIYMNGMTKSLGRGQPHNQLCVCTNGRLFMAAQGADCRADRNICE
ncbi:unnamed protein product, partial [Mesorhabditis belari]|uniref:Sarcoglycan complex subunit protein n=1 Tax=Mesorhabditis belari TaxID=2138241 RepID=A0AAF3EFD2_9BILA